MRQLPKWVVTEEDEPADPTGCATPADGPGGMTERGERHPVKLNGHAIREDGSHARLAVVDLSYDGCAVECETELRSGEAIDLFVLGPGAISAQVRWCAAGRAGLVFDADSLATGKRPRRSKRELTAGEVTIRRCGGDRCYARVFDASPLGCKVEMVAELEERVWIKFEGLQPLEAQVCWADRSSAGVRFSTPIHPAVFDLLMQRLDQPRRHEWRPGA